VTEDVAAVIRERIARDGPIRFDAFMELALYGPGGYYQVPPIGSHGDFVTSPHVHPAFGAFVARALAPMRTALGTDVLRVTEVGAGDGTLARQILAAMPDARYTAVEVSEGARGSLTRIDGLRVARRLEPPVDVVLAHELLDNIPFRLVRDGREVRIGVDGGAFVERSAPLDDELRALLGVPPEGDVVVPVGALAFVDRIGAVLERGYAVLIDYGEEGSGGPVHGYRAHRPIDDILAHPGASDITAAVDFGLIAARARDRGLQAFPVRRQTDVLLALGLEGWLRDELDTQRDQLAGGRGLDAVRTWSGRSRATMLADPSGLGRTSWLVLATPGLPEPTWLQGPERRDDRSIDRPP
jgi:SAM-dependent MidA family methyltransferase